MADITFADVTDITIPQGETVKIHETDTGRVLWEKSKFKVSVQTVNDITGSYWKTGFENGNNITLLSSNVPGYCTYKPTDDTFSSISKTTVQTTDADIDPTSKVWITVGDGYGIDSISGGSTTINIETSFGRTINHNTGPNTAGTFASFLATCSCRWISALNKFCVLADTQGNKDISYAFLVGTDGLISNWSTIDTRFYRYGGFEGMCYSPTLNKIAAIFNRNSIGLSSNGLSWNITSPGFTIFASSSLHWITTKNFFILFEALSRKMYKSTNGINWQEISSLPSNFSPNTHAWSPTKKIFISIANGRIYLTDDFETWETVNGTPISPSPNTKTFWSDKANAFIHIPNRKDIALYKIFIN